MKIKDIVNEGLLGSIGRGLGKVASLPLKTLDALAGGSGQVGTANQQFAVNQKTLKKREALQDKANLTAVEQSYDNFNDFLAKQGIRLNDPRTYTDESLAPLLKGFALYFYGSDSESGPYIKAEINKFPVPAKLNPGSIKKYLNDTGQFFIKINKNILLHKISKLVVDKEKPKPEPAPSSQSLPPNVKVLATNPIVLQVGKERFELDDNDVWHPLNRPNISLSPGQTAVLNNYLSMM